MSCVKLLLLTLVALFPPLTAWAVGGGGGGGGSTAPFFSSPIWAVVAVAIIGAFFSRRKP